MLYNDFGGTPPLTAAVLGGPTAGTLDSFGSDGSFVYTPGPTMTDNVTDEFSYEVTDAFGNTAQA